MAEDEYFYKQVSSWDSDEVVGWIEGASPFSLCFVWKSYFMKSTCIKPSVAIHPESLNGSQLDQLLFV